MVALAIPTKENPRLAFYLDRLSSEIMIAIIRCVEKPAQDLQNNSMLAGIRSGTVSPERALRTGPFSRNTGIGLGRSVWFCRVPPCPTKNWCRKKSRWCKRNTAASLRRSPSRNPWRFWSGCAAMSRGRWAGSPRSSGTGPKASRSMTAGATSGSTGPAACW
jgi:hypothetical protein